jgi:hypothetical protein
MRQPNWTYQASMYLPKEHCMVYRDDTLGVQLQVMTRRRRFPWLSRVREFYFIDGVDRAFRSEKSMLEGLRRRVARTGRQLKNFVFWRRVAYVLNLL